MLLRPHTPLQDATVLPNMTLIGGICFCIGGKHSPTIFNVLPTIDSDQTDHAITSTLYFARVFAEQNIHVLHDWKNILIKKSIVQPNNVVVASFKGKINVMNIFSQVFKKNINSKF